MDAPIEFEKPPSARPSPQSPEGCLAVAIRVPVRIVVLVFVVPVRLVWDALVVGGRFLHRTVLRPLARAVFVWPWVALWRYVVVPVAKAIGWLANLLVLVPLVWLYRYVLTPVGHALAWMARGVGAGLTWVYARVLTPVGHACAWVLEAVVAVVAWLGRYLVVVPAGWLYAWILTPVGHAIAWCGRGLLWLVRAVGTGVGVVLYWTARILLVLPAVALWRWVLTPVGRVLAVVGREIWDALGHAWRIAGHISLAVGRFLGTLFRWIFVEPVSWVYRTILTPVGHVVRDLVLRPAAEAARGVSRVTRQMLSAVRESARQARADFRRMVFGEPRQPQPVERREPTGGETRTLDSSTTVLTKD
nr:hypothetical protein OG999_35760 [Streptomyces sp. NBC_00886]